MRQCVLDFNGGVHGDVQRHSGAPVPFQIHVFRDGGRAGSAADELSTLDVDVFNFGGNFALFPAATADLFGNKNVGENYPWVFLAYGVGGIAGPFLGGAMGDAKIWAWAFVPAGIACLVAAGLAMLLRPVGAAVQPAES